MLRVHGIRSAKLSIYNSVCELEDHLHSDKVIGFRVTQVYVLIDGEDQSLPMSEHA